MAADRTGIAFPGVVDIGHDLGLEVTAEVDIAQVVAHPVRAGHEVG